MSKVIAALALLFALAACTHDQPAPARAPHPSPSRYTACSEYGDFADIEWQYERDMDAEGAAARETEGAERLSHLAAARVIATEIGKIESIMDELRTQCEKESK